MNSFYLLKCLEKRNRNRGSKEEQPWMDGWMDEEMDGLTTRTEVK